MREIVIESVENVRVLNVKTSKVNKKLNNGKICHCAIKISANVYLIIIIPVTAALLELQEVCKSGSVGCNTEVPGLPLSVRNP